MSISIHTGRDYRNVKLYNVLKDAHYLPDAYQEKALQYLKKIVYSTQIPYCDEYELRLCFSWHQTGQIGAGGYKFWATINDYLLRLRER
jgi:hypothetical protein